MSGSAGELCLLGPARAGELLAAGLAASEADATEVAVTARRASVLRFAGRRIHQPQDLGGLQVTVRAVVDGRAATVATSSPADVAAAARTASFEARRLAASPRRGEAAHQPAAPDAGPATDRDHLWAEETVGWTPAARAGQYARLHATTERHDADLAGTLVAAGTEMAVGTSLGCERYAAATEASLSLTVECRGGSSHAERLERDASSFDVDRIGAELLDEALRMGRPAEVPPGVYDVVLGSQATGELIEFLPHLGFTAAALAAGVGVVASASRSFSPLVTIADDATSGPGLPFPFDREGVTKRRVEMISRGTPAGVVSDLATGAVTGGSTGHAHVAREEAPAARAANLRLEAGASTVDGLIAGVERGIYIQRFWYTRLVDAGEGVITGTTRDASFLIRDGRLAGPLACTRFTESVLGALERVDGVGDVLSSQPVLNVWNGAVSAPAVRVRGFRLGTTERRREERAR